MFPSEAEFSGKQKVILRGVAGVAKNAHCSCRRPIFNLIFNVILM